MVSPPLLLTDIFQRDDGVVVVMVFSSLSSGFWGLSVLVGGGCSLLLGCCQDTICKVLRLA